MRVPRNRWFWSGAVVVVLAGSGVWLAASPHRGTDLAVEARATRGDFVVTVMTSGELRARQFVQITAPVNAQQAGAYQMRIQSLVPEGTLVKAGDIVAELDRATIGSRLTEVSTQLQKAQAQFEQAELDSTLNLSKAREEIKTMELGLEEKRLAKEQAAPR